MFRLLFLPLIATASQLVWRPVELDTNITLSVAFAGNPNATETIIFLHGFPSGAYQWHGIVETGMFDNKYKIIVPDLRGYNQSSQPPGVDAYQVKNIVADVVSLARKEAYGSKFHLVAHDWGGAIAWFLASEFQSTMVQDMYIVNMPHPHGWAKAIRNTSSSQAADSAYVLSFVNPKMTEKLTMFNDAGLKSIFANKLDNDWFSEDGKYFEQSWKVPGSVDKGLNWYRANMHPNCPLSCTEPACWQQGFTSAFDNLTTPILINVAASWGMADTAFDNEWQINYMKTSGLVPNLGKIARYPDNTHWLAEERPDDVAADLHTFLSEQ